MDSSAPSQQELLHRALDLEAITVREIMVSRPTVSSLPGDMPLEEAAARVIEELHSRIPIYDPALVPEAIIGVLYSKDLMRWMQLRLLVRGQSFPISCLPSPALTVRHIMRDVLVVPETKPLPDLLDELKNRRRHLAIVVDEFGSTAGVVSVEDVLEQLVGEIEDEFDIVPRANLGNPASLVLDAALNIRDLESSIRN